MGHAAENLSRACYHRGVAEPAFGTNDGRIGGTGTTAVNDVIIT